MGIEHMAPQNHGVILMVECRTTTLTRSYSKDELNRIGWTNIPENFKGSTQEVADPSTAKKLKSIGDSFAKTLAKEGFNVVGGGIFVPKGRWWKARELEEQYTTAFNATLEDLVSELDENNLDYRNRFGVPEQIQYMEGEIRRKCSLRLIKQPACLTLDAGGTNMDDVEDELSTWASEGDSIAESQFVVKCTNILRTMARDAAQRLQKQLSKQSGTGKLIGKTSLKAFIEFSKKFDELNWIGDSIAAHIVKKALDAVGVYSNLVSSDTDRSKIESDLEATLKKVLSLPKIQDQTSGKTEAPSVMEKALKDEAEAAVEEVSEAIENDDEDSPDLGNATAYNW